MKILFIGESWNGSNSTGLRRGFSSLGHIVETVSNEEYFTKGHSIIKKISNKLTIGYNVSRFNKRITKVFQEFQPSLTVIYKGSYVSAPTIKSLKQKSKVVCVFPDISPINHVDLDTSGFKYYDTIFSTKSFGYSVFKTYINKSCEVVYLPHGCDPFVHRPMFGDQSFNFDYDVTFIGGYSPNKEELIKTILINRSDLSIKIMGPGWNMGSEKTKKNWLGTGVYGDDYSSAICKSKINLGLLHEIPYPGDNITSRTFHIPACGGFMLHEYSKQLEEVLLPRTECGVFVSKEDLLKKIDYYLINEELRKSVAINGYKRIKREHTLAHRARQIINVVNGS